MTNPDFRALCAELVALDGHCVVDCTEEWADAMCRARNALAQPEPVAPSEWHLLSFEQPSVNALCEYICHPTNWEVIQGKGKWYEQANPTVSGFTYSHGLFVSNPTQTLWRLAQPEPQPPAAIVEMVNKLHQINNPAIQPVPVSERLPGPEDCNAEGGCWFWHPGHKEDDFIDGWILLDSKWAGSRRDSDDSLIYTHWLPHWVLPVPAPAIAAELKAQ